jgi:benzoyl-CoA reductase subunit C
VYLLVRAGNVLPVEEHTKLLRRYLDEARGAGRRPLDMARVVVVGSFCEQPPLDLIKTLEQAGCYIVQDDYVLGARWIGGDVATDGDPLEALVHAYLTRSVPHASVYIGEGKKGAALVEQVRQSGAEGVLFAAPSFCDPALLDQPMLQAALDEAGIPYTAVKYSENTGQFQVIREQAGTFADTIKLWSNR